jgi:hypothetical protein
MIISLLYDDTILRWLWLCFTVNIRCNCFQNLIESGKCQVAVLNEYDMTVAALKVVLVL